MGGGRWRWQQICDGICKFCTRKVIVLLFMNAKVLWMSSSIAFSMSKLSPYLTLKWIIILTHKYTTPSKPRHLINGVTTS